MSDHKKEFQGWVMIARIIGIFQMLGVIAHGVALWHHSSQMPTENAIILLCSAVFFCYWGFRNKLWR